MWNLKSTNYICRIITDKENKFKFDVLLRTDVCITNGKSYDTFEEASKELCSYLNKIYEYDNKLDMKGNKHLIINETIFE